MIFVYIWCIPISVTEELLYQAFVTSLQIIQMIKSFCYGTEGCHNHHKPCNAEPVDFSLHFHNLVF